MATLDQRGGGFRIIFYFQGKRFQHPLKTEKKREAEQLRVLLERNLDLVHQGAMEVPAGVDLPVFLLSSGKTSALPRVEKRVSLGDFFERYRLNRPPGKEANTAYTQDIHIEHLLRHLGRRSPLDEIPDRLQEYITLRSQEKGRRGAAVSDVTVRKELSTLSGIWNRWGVRQKLVTLPLNLKNLDYPKKRDKPPFQTWEQIERKIAQGASPELWDSVFLTPAQIELLLAHVRTAGSTIRGRVRHFDFTYPLFAFCAHTGARRSEMLRSRREDFDFERNVVTIREKKKDTSREETYRHVPMTLQLRNVIRDWFNVHPGGAFTFCRTAEAPLTEQMANHHFRWALEGSPWKVIRGWHCFRHSLISNLACRGVNERVIMGIVGHLNPETTRRYLHLYPSTVQAALDLVFGSGAEIANPL